MPLSYLVIAGMFAPFGLICGMLIVQAERAGRASFPIQELAAAFLAAAGAFGLTVIIHEVGHWVAGHKHGLRLLYAMFFGVTYNVKERRLTRVPGLTGALGAVVFDRLTEDLPAFRSMLIGGIKFNLITVPIAAGFALIPGTPELLRIFAVATAFFSLGFALINAIPLRLNTTAVSDGYLIRWLKHDPPSLKRQMDWSAQLRTYFFCSPRDWDLPVLMNKHASPEDYPFRQMLRLIHAQDQNDPRMVGEILEEGLAHWPRGAPGNLTGSLLGEAAVFFTQTVDHPARAEHYEKRVKRNLQYPTLELAPLKVIRLVRSGKRKSAETMVNSLVRSLDAAPPALRENVQRRYAAMLESGPPQFTAAEWNEFCQSRLGDA
jgi:hypothetical protein